MENFATLYRLTVTRGKRQKNKFEKIWKILLPCIVLLLQGENMLKKLDYYFELIFDYGMDLAMLITIFIVGYITIQLYINITG